MICKLFPFSLLLIGSTILLFWIGPTEKQMLEMSIGDALFEMQANDQDIDPWGTPVRRKKLVAKDKEATMIATAGPDKKWNTDDDYCLVIDKK